MTTDAKDRLLDLARAARRHAHAPFSNFQVGAALETADGQVSLSRPDGRNATLAWPGRPERRVALHRRDTPDLIAEELRRLEPDEVYAEALRGLARGTGSAVQ